MRPTTIRSKAVSKYFATVVSVMEGDKFEVWFQIYLVLSKGRTEGGPFVMVREDKFDTELDATAMFEAWVKESKLLVAVGDM